VERAIDTVLAGLERYGAPLYVRRAIVHNEHVVADLAGRGAVFVEEFDEVPVGAHVVISAHGVSPAVRAAAEARGLAVIDATCPLVSKVHAEVRRFAARGREIVLIGHAGHDEVEGTLGEAPGIHLVSGPGDVAALDLDAATPVAYATQTTLATGDVARTVTALAERYPDLVGPPASDICYATQNRQEAVASVAADCEVTLVVGSATSSNANRLVELAGSVGSRAHLVADETAVDPAWLAGARTVGLTAAASTPETLVTRVLAALASLGPLEIERRDLTAERVTFPLPLEVR
jgi:4-hydroxy-3-methylbut-2-enyl diphosphate reductase